MFTTFYQSGPYVEVFNAKDAKTCKTNFTKNQHYSNLVKLPSTAAYEYDSLLKSNC